MPPVTSIVLSASRRTDIPAFYMPWFMAQIKRGFFVRINPYNRRKSVVQVSPEIVHSIIFWSKDYGPLLRSGQDAALVRAGYPLFFNFTINSRDRLLEPHVPPLSDRLTQLETLGRRYDPRAIAWRFDPICFYRRQGQPVTDNLADFKPIARKVAACGIRRCITSFMDDYAKIRKRVASMDGFAFVFLSAREKAAIIMEMRRILQDLDIALFTCCEKQVLEVLPEDSGVRPAACIPNDLLGELYGGRPSLKKDSGQRVSQGCGCYAAVDVGSYDLHPCRHSCLYCYANPCSEPTDEITANRARSAG